MIWIPVSEQSNLSTGVKAPLVFEQQQKRKHPCNVIFQTCFCIEETRCIQCGQVY